MNSMRSSPDQASSRPERPDAPVAQMAGWSIQTKIPAGAGIDVATITICHPGEGRGPS